MEKRRLATAEVALVLLEVLVAVSALGGGGLLIADPSGAREGMPPAAAFPRMPWGSYLVPGLLLLVANGIFPLVVALGTMAGRRWARTGHLVVGAVLATWIAVQLVLIGPVYFGQAFVAAIAVAILALGLGLRARHEAPGGAGESSGLS